MSALRFVQNWLRQMARHSLWLEYAGLAALVLLPLLVPGYVLALDMSWGPLRPAGDIFSNTWLLNGALGLIGHLVPGWLVQKAVLALIFVLGGVGAHRIVRLTRVPLLAAYAAGLLYVVNPFVYTRFVTGQWLVLAGWALLPWAIAALWRLLTTPNWSTAWRVTAWLAAIGLTSVHTAAMLALVVPVVVAFGFRPRRWRTTLGWLTGAIAAALLINGVWLFGVISGQGTVEASIAGFGAAQQQAFASQASVAGSVPLATLALQGFWADLQHRYVLPVQGGWLWASAAIVLGASIVFGLYQAVRRRDRLALALTVLGIMAWILAIGTAWGPTTAVTDWLNRYVPFYSGYREPQKWLMLLLLAYAYGFSQAVSAIGDRLRQRAPQLLTVQPAILMLPILTGSLLLFGAHGQLRAAAYPNGWAVAEQVMRSRSANQAVVVLPWHMYMPIGFAGRTVANPAQQYFSGRVIIGTDPELRGVPAESSDPLAVQAAQFALRRDPQVLRSGKIAYIIVLKEADWRRYAWLDRQAGLRLVSDTATTRTYAVRSAR